MMWSFQVSMPNCVGFRAFQSFRPPCFFVCSPFIHTLLLALYFFVYTTLTLYKSLQWMSLGNLTKIPGKSKSLRRQWQVLHFFWKLFMFTILFWLSLNSSNLPEGQDTFQMIKKHPTQCRNFMENKGTVRTIW